MKRLILTALLLAAFNTQASSDAPKKVLISQIVEHPALDATTQGIIDALTAVPGYVRDNNLIIRVESAQANPAIAQQIASKFLSQQPDVVVGVGTVTAQSFAKAARAGKVKLIFSSITDPVGAGLAKSLAAPGNNTSGVSNFLELAPQLELFKQLQPGLKKLGILYNPGEANSVSIVTRLESLCPQLGLQLVKQVITKTADVAQNTTKLAQEVDAIFISNDNTALGALQSVIKAANNAEVPVYVSDTDAVDLGAVAALGPNQYQVGIQTGRMIAAVLAGTPIAEIAIEFPIDTDLYINLDAANKVGLQIPADIQRRATKIVKASK
jgi:putative ABC transport system substrate-binding protein